MAKKSELEQSVLAYGHQASAVQKELAAGNLVQALKLSVASLQYIDEMMQYGRKYAGAEFDNIDTIETILRYAPVMFEVESLNAVDRLLKYKKSVDKHATDDIAALLEEAREDTNICHKLWTHLEENPGCWQRNLGRTLSCDPYYLRTVIEIWESQGFLHRTAESNSFRLTLLCDFEQKVTSKCSSCGAIAAERIHLFWHDQICPKCSSNTSFVILSD